MAYPSRLPAHGPVLPMRFTIYRSLSDGQWYWRLRARKRPSPKAKDMRDGRGQRAIERTRSAANAPLIVLSEAE